MVQDLNFVIFFLEKPQSLKKNEKRYSNFYYKNRNTNKFNSFTIKNYFGNPSESVVFRCENSFKGKRKTLFDFPL